DEYRRGGGGILTKARADSIMCCGHKEYALPVGRKNDPTFDMDDFRIKVAGIMGGTAPRPSVIPAVDAENRPTLRRGATDELVQLVQTKVGVPATGSFDGNTEAAVRRFQRDHGLVPDGIVGPRTWATLMVAVP